ncbi:MAG: BatD family protein [Anaerolineae bacterium]|nr:BatD family protein [Anaerolineae bacterium]
MTGWVWLALLGLWLWPVAQAPAGEPYFVTAELSPVQSVVAGQQVSYIVTAYSDTVREVVLTPPVFDGMYQGDVRSVGSSATVGGKQYNVVTFAVTVYPWRSGVIDLPPAEVIFEGTVFADTEVRESNPVSVEVMAVPDTDGFSGLVGRHEADFEVLPVEAALGQPLTAVYRVRGTGYVDGLPAPVLALPDGWRAYLDPVQATSAFEGTIVVSEKTFRWRIIPDRAGALTVGMQPLTVYDLPTWAFVTLEVATVPVQIVPGPNGETVRASVQAALDNAGIGLPVPAALTPVADVPGWVWVSAPLWMGLAAMGVWSLRQGRAAAREQRRRTAFDKAQRALERLKNKTGESALRDIERAAAAYLSDKDAPMSDGLREALLTVESARYAPQVEGVAALAAGVLAALDEMECAEG